MKFTKIANIPPYATSHRIAGLKGYTRYVINMAAVNEIGVGVSSDDVTVWTEEDGKFFIDFILFIYSISTGYLSS